MALKYFLTFAVVLSILCTAAVGAVVGGWQPIKNPNDRALVKIAKFAVKEYNKLHIEEALVLVSVERGETKKEAAGGTQYKLVLSIKIKNAASPKWPPINYLALVWDKPQEKQRELLQFYQITN
ncbi:hypothetical protein ACJIZ3_002866 [Penstemon smallii]|uniref:Cystatin domain-containing protein n=1 Tax=Penstemon smallii TaxID=265156 RepID=A0ABD3UBD7_9LAMI